MALKDKTQVMEPVAATFSVLPSHYPELPAEVLTRFPRMSDWYSEVQRIHRRVGEALASIDTDYSQAFTDIDSRTTSLSASLTTDVATLTAMVNTETTARISGDAALASQITTLTTNYQAADTALQANITAEATARSNADSAEASTRSSADATLQSNINTVSASVTTETNARVSADNALASSITTLTATVNLKNQTFRQASAPTAVATGDIWIDTDDSAMYRWDGASWVNTTIAASAISAAVSSEASARASADAAEASTRSSADATLQTNINTVSASVTTEASARATADGYLAGKYTLTVAAGDVVTGMNITSASGSGTNVSEVAFQADKFQIYSGTNKKVMFVADAVNDLVKLSNTLVVSTSGKVFIGTGTYGNSNTAFYVDSAGQFSLKDKLTWDGTTLTINGGGTFSGALSAATGTFAGSLSAATGSFSGTVTATAGSIGGFSIGTDYIRDTGDSFGLASTVSGSDDIRFWAGSSFASRGSAPFRVTEGGSLYATSATIQGTIKTGTTIEAGVLPSGNLAQAGGGGSAASSSYTNMSPDLTVTLTCDGQKKRIELVSGEIANATGSPQTCYAAIYRDGSVLVAELGNGNGILLDASESAPIQLVGFDTPSAGSHTYNIRVKGSAGGSVACGGTISVS
jgi:hypothetical protein